MENEIVTMKDVARVAGVSYSTVSRALRNLRGTNLETCRRIQALAKRMGYRPDPALTALAAYRFTNRPTARFEKLAILVNGTDSVSRLDTERMNGIRSRAAALGFETEPFALLPDEASQHQVSRMLHARGVRGLLVMALPWQPTAFEWDKFVVVGLGENAMPLQVNYVRYDHDHAVSVTYEELRRHGYTNIGFMNNQASEARNRYLFLSAYLKCRFLDNAPPAPPLLVGPDSPPLLKWIRAHRFDAVMTIDRHMQRHVEGTEFASPERLGIARFHSPCHTDQLAIASYVVDEFHSGEVAVDLVQSLMNKNQVGIPALRNRCSITLRGYWKDGPSLRPAPQAAGQGAV